MCGGTKTPHWEKIDEDLGSIVFICDAQGFTIDRAFYPREFAIVGDRLNLCMDVDTGLEESHLDEKNIHTYKYAKTFIHGLSLRPARVQFGYNCMQTDDVCKFIKDCYDNVKTGIKFRIGYKNASLEPLLKSLDIPLLNLADEKYSCPKIEFLDKYFIENKSFVCSSHQLPANCSNCKKKFYFRCSLRKSNNLWRWVQISVKDYFKKKSVSACNTFMSENE